MAIFHTFKSPLLHFLVVSLVFSFLIQPGITSSKKNVESLVVDSDPDVQQRISILVGKAGKEETPKPDESNLDNVPTDTGGDSNDVASVNTNSKSCPLGGARCCYQYTWQGYIEPNQVPAPENTTCEYFRKAKKDTTSACFDPMIFTSRDPSAEGDVGNPPDMNALAELSKDENWNVFCPLTPGISCLTYRFYSRGGTKQIVNETRFCGSVSDLTTGNRITSGCYTESVQSYIKEVCICQDRSLCNSVSQVKCSLTAVVTLIVAVTTFWNHF